MATKTNAQILLETDGGLQLFKLLLPNLTMESGRNKVNVDSPISKGKKCISVFYWNGKYRFKDHFNQMSGDIFTLVAEIHKLHLKTEFIKVIDICEALMNSNMATIPDEQKTRFVNNENGDVLTVADIHISIPFVQKHLMGLMHYLENYPDYEIQLVDSFSICMDNKTIYYAYDFSIPKDAYYAIVIKKAQYYILFNPKTMKSYQFGMMPEFYMFGIDNLFKTAYTKNIYLRDTLVLTNKVEGVLWCEDKGIPCLAVINSETSISEYFAKEILPKFNNRLLLLEGLGNSSEQRSSFINNYGFTHFLLGESYLSHFFRLGDKAIEKMYNQFEQVDDYEYIGLQHKVEMVTTENEY